MIRVRALIAVTAVALGGAGCGPIEYLATVPLDAAGAIAQAKQLGADKRAPYEMTAAEEYVHKARELAGHARYQSSVRFGRKAAENAHKAVAMCSGEGGAQPASEPAK